jgi:hypothetical protein
MVIAFLLGGLIGGLGMAVLSANAYQKGYEDGKSGRQ